MPTDRFRPSVSLDPAVAATLGYDPGLAENRTAYTISCPLARYAWLIARANRELAAVLTRAEWNLIAAVLNGTRVDDLDPGLDRVHPLHALCLEIEDGHRLNREGDRWLTPADGVPTRAQRAEADAAVADLLARLRALTPTHADAITAAVRWFWQHPTDIDHQADEWWTPAFRLKAVGE